MNILLWKFIKYCVVGFTGMFIDFATTWFLKEKCRINKYIANSSGFILAAFSNYLLNRIWTFKSLNTQVMTQYLTFIIISLAGLGINTLLIYLFAEKMKLNFYLSKLIAIVFVTIWNFALNSLITFR